MRATMSIAGMWNYRNDLFDNIVLPDGVDNETVIDSIILECGEFELLYSDADFMKMIIGVWSTKELSTWTKLYTACQSDYDPIENYNRYEDWSETASGTGTSNITNTGKVSGFDDVEFANQDQTTTAGGSSTDGTAAHTGRIHGNIGVTTSQQMLESELAVRPKLNIYNIIADSFKNRFCLAIY